MPNILAHIENVMTPGTTIPKPQAKADFVVKGWGIRRGERALIYTMPNHRRSGETVSKGNYEFGVDASIRAFAERWRF